MPSSLKRILVADHQRHWVVYQQALPSFELDFVNGEKEIIERIRESSFDLISLSYSLFEENGLAFVKSVIAETDRKIPVLLILEKNQEKIAIAAKQDGVSDYLNRDELLPAIVSMSVVRALEHRKWQKIYEKVSAAENTSAIKDPITDLYSVFYLKTRLDEEISRSSRYHFPITMIFFQIEQFRHINERYGYEAGDHVLHELGQLFMRNIRSSDLLSRVRDDHFALLLPHTTVDQTQTAWNRIMDEIKNHPFTVGKENFFVSLRAVLIPLGTDTAPVYRMLDHVGDFIKQHAATSEVLQLVKPVE